MTLDDYANGAKAIAERYGVADYLGVQLDSGHLRFDGYPFSLGAQIGMCVGELGSYRDTHWESVPKSPT